MKFDINDSRLTAYVLGELNDSEKQSIEQLLRENSRARAFVEEIKATTLLLENEFKTEPLPMLDQQQRQMIESRFPKNFFSWFNWKWSLSLVPVALGILLVINLRLIDFGRKDEVVNTTAIPQAPVAVAPKPATPPLEETYFAQNSGGDKSSPSAGASAEAEVEAESLDGEAIDSKVANSPTIALTEPVSDSSAVIDLQGGKKVGSAEAFKAGLAANMARGKAKSFAANDSVAGYSVLAERQNKGDSAMGVSSFSVAAKSVGIRQPIEIASNTERYGYVKENSFLKVSDQPLSTFSIDVDTASYSNVRRFLTQGQLPPKDAVRIEEMINYFSYDYKEPADGKPFSVNLEMAAAPWDGNHQLVRIGLKGQSIHAKERPASNLVFLIDVSGSMIDANKLPLLKSSMKLLVRQLTKNDRVSIVVYAGSSGVVLPPTHGDESQAIIAAIDNLQSSGSTNGAQGISAAYSLAKENFIKGGVNRVILATDGDFNVGVSSEGELIRLIQEKAKMGVFLSVLGFGSGNLNDSMMVKLADKGNGHFAYIDTLNEAKKVLVDEIGGTLVTIAKDVKIQVEFNPKQIASYRLIGYEKRALQNEEFNDDKVDAGDIGAGHTVTALYEVVPKAKDDGLAKIDPLKYQNKATLSESGSGLEALTVKLRYKKPDGDKSLLLEVPMNYEPKPFTEASSDFQFASSVASFGMLLRDSDHKATTNFSAIANLAEKNLSLKGAPNSHRKEFVGLVRKAQRIKSSK